MATTTGLKTTCYLLDLPPELRVRIYQYVFDVRPFWNHITDAFTRHYVNSNFPSFDFDLYPAGPCYLHIDETQITRTGGKPLPSGPQCPIANFAAILRTCKLIHNEATDVLYDQTCFKIDFRTESKNPITREATLLDHPVVKDNLQLSETPQYFRLLQHAHFRIQVYNRRQLSSMTPIIKAVLPALNPQRSSTKVIFDIHLNVVGGRMGVIERVLETIPNEHPDFNTVDWQCSPEVFVHLPLKYSAQDRFAAPFRRFADLANASLRFVGC